MDGDTIMQGSEESDYPDPTSEERTPYPSLPQHTFTGRPTPPSFYTSRSFHRPLAPKTGNTDKDTSRGFTSLSDYFNLGSPIASRNKSHDLEDGNNRAIDADSPEDSDRRPWTSDFFSRLASAGNTDASTSADGRGKPRGRPRIRPEGRRRGGWKWALRGTEHADLFTDPKKSRGPTGRKTPRPRGRPRGSVNATGDNWIDPGVEFRELMGEATRAWLDGDNDTALEHAKMAVKVNSEVFMAHKMIHDILQAQGDERGALVALSVGVNTKRDPKLWAEVADGILALGDRNANDAEWAKSCYVEALKVDAHCYSARTGKLRLAEEMEDWDAARLECKGITKHWPGDLDYVYKYAELCGMTGNIYEWERAKEAYETAFEYYADKDMLGQHVDQQWTHLNVYLDILLKLGLYQEGINQLKRLARWFLGRKDDAFWDEVLDDREFDSTNERRVHQWQFQQGRISRDMSQYGDGLPLELRVKLGLFRMRMMAREEAFRHFEHLKGLESGADGYEDMFLEVAECLKGYAMFGEALKYYESVKMLQNSGNQNFWLGIAQCYNAVGRNDDAMECYLNVSKTDEYHIEARIQLARFYDAAGQHDRASKMADEVTRLGKLELLRRQKPPVEQTPPKRLPKLLPKGVPGAQSQAQPPVLGNHDTISPGLQLQVQNGDMAGGQHQTKKQRVQGYYSALKRLSSVDAGDNEDVTRRWMEHAAALQAEFKGTGRFYLNISLRNNNAIVTQASSLPLAVIQEMESMKRKAGLEGEMEPTLTIDETTFGDFCGVSLAECHRIFSDLALLYAKLVDQEKCYDMLQNMLMKPNVFRLDPELWNTTQAVRLCCALMFNDSKLMTEAAQEYISRGKRGSGMAMQLFAATGRLYHGDAYFDDAKTRRWIHDVVDAQDSGTMNADESGDGKTADTPTAHTNGSESKQGEVDPGLLTVCGHSALTHQNANARPALPYLLCALAIQPENLVINLSIAITYIANAMRKGASNRQYEIAQGQAFFYRYYDLRIASGNAGHLQEAEFNLARMWHQLGLTHLAVPAYEKVLKLSSDVQKEYADGDGADGTQTETEDFAMEAAFALQSIFVAAGNEEAARAITEEWLVL